MRVHQVTSQYLAEDDRLLLRINVSDQAEFRFTLTRRYAKQMLHALAKIIGSEQALLAEGDITSNAPAFDSPTTKQKIMRDPETKKAMMEFEHESAIAKADFEKKYMGELKNTPLGKEPILATGLSFTPHENQLPTMSIVGKDGKGLNISLSKTLLHSFYKLLVDAANNAGWDLPFGPLQVKATGDDENSSDKLN